MNVQRSAFVNDTVLRFRQQHGFSPDLVNPQRFSEKLLWRILFDRNPYYLLHCNKLYVRSYLLPKEIEGLRFVRLYQVKHVISPADFRALPNQFVIKSVYASGLNEIVVDKNTCDVQKICDRFNSEMPVKRNAQGFTYPYNCAIFEEYLGGPEGGVPDDFKFHCFRQPDGDYDIIVQVDSGRFSNHRRTFLDRSFNPLPVQIGPHAADEICPKKPAQFDLMLRIAKTIAAGFDYVRIDLYSVGSEIYFGEITPFHGGAMRRIAPPEWDFRLGKMWHLTLPSYAPEGTSS